MLRLLVILSGILLLYPPQIIAQESFPEKCMGNWGGTLYIYQKGQLKDSVSVTLEVKPSGQPKEFHWVTTYESEEHPLVKDYLLQIDQQEPEKYILKEGEGVELLMYGFDNKLYSLFETQNTMLSSTYEIRNDTLYFETSSASQQATGSVVTSFQIGYLQKAVFTRILP